MKILIMRSKNDNAWYKDKIGKSFEAREVKSGFATKQGVVKKEDAAVI